MILLPCFGDHIRYPEKEGHRCCAGAIENNIPWCRSARGLKTLVEFVERCDDENEQDRKQKSVFENDRFCRSRPSSDGPKGEQRIFEKVSAFADKTMKSFNCFRRGSRPEKTKDGLDKARGMRGGCDRARKKEDQRDPKQKRAVKTRPLCP